MNADPNDMPTIASELTRFAGYLASASRILYAECKGEAMSEPAADVFNMLEGMQSGFRDLAQRATNLAGATDGPGAEEMLEWAFSHDASWYRATKTLEWSPFDGVRAWETTEGTDWRDAITKAMAEERALRVAEAASEGANG